MDNFLIIKFSLAGSAWELLKVLKISFSIPNVTMLSVFFGNFIFALIARTFSGNRLKLCLEMFRN